jgi:hypothetical protein
MGEDDQAARSRGVGVDGSAARDSPVGSIARQSAVAVIPS